MRTPEEIAIAKENVRGAVNLLVDYYKVIDTEMAKLPSRKGTAHQSLNQKTGEYVTRNSSGAVNIDFIAENGTRYSIQIQRRG